MPRPAEIEVDEWVVFALGPLGEAGEAAALAQRANAVAAGGENLVRVGLMADIPDDPVARRVEHVMQRDGQFDNAQAGAEVAAGHRNRRNGFLAQFVGEPTQLVLGQPAQISRHVNPVEKWCL
jgi:hypothetical protein